MTVQSKYSQKSYLLQKKTVKMTQSPCWQGATLRLIAHKWRPL